jgi:hypothetical protein
VKLPQLLPKEKVLGAYCFFRPLHILPPDGPTKVPLFKQDCLTLSQSPAICGLPAPAEPRHCAAAWLHVPAAFAELIQVIDGQYL